MWFSALAWGKKNQKKKPIWGAWTQKFKVKKWFKLFCSFTKFWYFMVKIAEKQQQWAWHTCVSESKCVYQHLLSCDSVSDFVIEILFVCLCVFVCAPYRQLLSASCFMPHWGPYWLVQFLFVFSPLFWSSDAALRNPLAFAKTALTAPEAFGKIALNG